MPVPGIDWLGIGTDVGTLGAVLVFLLKHATNGKIHHETTDMVKPEECEEEKGKIHTALGVVQNDLCWIKKAMEKNGFNGD